MAEVPLGDYSVVVPDDLVADQQPAPSGSTGPTQTDAGNPWGLDPSVYAQLTGSPASVATAPQQPALSAAPPDAAASQLGQAIAPSPGAGAAAPASALAGAGAAAPPDVASMLAAQGSPVSELPSNAVAEQQAAAQAAMTPEQRQQAAANALLSQPVQADAQNPLGGMVGSLESQGNIAQAAGMSKAAQFGEDAKILADRNKANAIVQQQIVDDQAKKQQLEQQKYDEFNKAIEAERSFQIDKNGAWHSASTGQKIAGVMGAIIGGLGAAVGSTPGHVMDNPALKVIQDTIKADVDAQYKQRENLQWQVGAKKQSLDTYRQMSGDAIQAKQMALAQGYRNAADQMEQVATKYGGPQAVLAAKDAAEKLRFQANGVIAQASSAQAAGLLAKQKAAQEQANKNAELGLKQQEIGLGYYKESRADARALLEHTDKGIDRKQAAADKLTADQRERGLGGMPVTVAVTDKDGKPQVDADGNPVTKDTRNPFLFNKDGSPALFADKDAADAGRKQMAGTTRVVDAIDHLIQIRRDEGWSSDLAKNKNWQEAQAEFHNAVLGEHNAENIPRLTGDAIEQMEGLMGDLKDPTRWNGIEPGLRQARDIVIRNMRGTINANPGNDVEFDIPDVNQGRPPAVTHDDKVFKDAVGLPSFLGSNIPPQYSTYINDLGEVVSSRDPATKQADKAKAYERLSDLSNNADNQTLRDAAQAALFSGVSAGIQ